MPHAITENQANANFSTSISLPDNGGDTFQDGVDIWEAAHQQHADRSQRLRLWQPSDTPNIRPILSAAAQGGSEFTLQHSSGRQFWQQTSVAAAGNVNWNLGGMLPIGRKITGVTAYWQNPNNTTLPVGTMPTIALLKKAISIGADFSGGGASTVVGSQVDTTAVVATYKLNHTIALTGLSEVIAEDFEYYVRLTGENGANALTGGILMGLRVTLGL